MDNEIQKLKTNEDNLKSKASQQHDYKNAELRRFEDGKNPELKGDDGKLLKTHNVCLNTAAGTSKQITYHDKATQTEIEEEDTIEKILKAITTLCTKVDSMDNEIQKLKTNEDNLKSKASQQHDYKNAELRRFEDGKNPELKGDDGKLLKTHNVCLNTAAGTSKQITYHDKATQTEIEEEDTIEKILKAITTLCTKVDSMDNEIQKLKTNEDNLKSKASQQHDYKNAELRRFEDGKNPELKGDDGKLLKTHNVCLNTAAGTSKQVSDKQHKNANLNQLFAKPLPKGHLDICP
ncbi:hypothetical protein MTR67_051612 [Solanum verrucosum]|uniref:Uncharacterized protein n=1 Tax=Solanum verrucosum TaxID=315347 RepID=A0AAF0V586_SOLVR|nr:hypothetical protein MTR67_051612 [Solanum verrucosum]